ncbi:Gfo/Idh/MocA family oxidoreductase [Haloarculaceae archaeon H-GB1-1]|nr:Gfo/Idh/MocA family oxidoreductase [Haloarculaceae archaeon H-GB1-1]
MSVDRTDVGVVGVGSMGQHHARVYDELPEANLVGVADANEEVAADVASTYETDARAVEDLLSSVDAVSIAVPTSHHESIVRRAIEQDVDVLVEKPIVADLDVGRSLLDQARERDLVLQVGHIERFNPAVQTLLDVVQDLDLIAVDARRLGPPLDRDLGDTVVYDLMIHDIDVLLKIVDAEVQSVEATGTQEGQHITANVDFENDVVANLTASRVTQQKVRDLSITAESCRVNVDYLDQSVEVHRHSLPEYVDADGDLRYRHESVIERPMVESREPLKAELEAFVDAVAERATPPVTGEDGLRALEIAQEIDRRSAATEHREMQPR